MTDVVSQLHRDAIVAFVNESDHPLSRFLHPDFKHVFVVVLDSQGYWLLLDSADGVPIFEVLCGEGEDVEGFLRARGHKTLRYRRQPFSESKWPLVVHNCVGMVKSVLGVSAPFAVTPYQLYRRLSR